MFSSVGDLAILGKLLEEHRLKLFTMIQRRLPSALAARIDPEDILSEVYLQAQRKWNDFKNQATLPAYVWLYGIARDCLIEAWRRETRDRRDPKRAVPWPEQSSVQLALDLVNPGTTPSAAAVREEVQQRVRQALTFLKDR